VLRSWSRLRAGRRLFCYGSLQQCRFCWLLALLRLNLDKDTMNGTLTLTLPQNNLSPAGKGTWTVGRVPDAEAAITTAGALTPHALLAALEALIRWLVQS